MKKRNFFKIAMAGIMVCSGFALVACGGSQDDQSAFKKMDSLVEEMKANSSSDSDNSKLFRTGNVYNLSSEFILSSFNLTEDKTYQALFALPMNYISSHYNILKDVEAKKDLTNEDRQAINQLKTDIDAMQSEYNKLNLQYQRLKTFPNASGHEIIYQGELQEYRYKTTDIVGTTYKVALSLANVEEEVLSFYTGKVTKSKLEVQDSVEIRDYLSLFVGQDYYTLLLKNSKSSNLSESVEVIENANNDFESFVKEICVPTELKVLSTGTSGGTTVAYNSKVDNLLKVNGLIKNDREIMTRATNEFSFYNFMLSYSGDEKLNIDNIKDLKNYEDIHVHAIEDYFSITLKGYTNNIKSVII